MSAWLRHICDDAVRMDWGDVPVSNREGELGDPRVVELAVVSALDQHDEECVRVSVLVRGEAGPSEVAGFRLLQSGRPFWIHTVELGDSPDAPPSKPTTGDSSADVIVGFVTGTPAELDVEISLMPVGGLSCPNVSYTIHATPEDGLVPACLGTGPLPLIAMPFCSGIVVHAGSSVPGRPTPRVRAVCARLRPDVRLAIASESFAMPLSRPGRCAPLPDLNSAIEAHFREPASRARTVARNSLIMQELMERVWAPDRVRRGFVEPLDLF